MSVENAEAIAYHCTHHVTNGQTQARWDKVHDDDLNVSPCICCWGPARPSSDLTAPPVCSRCTSGSDTT